MNKENSDKKKLRVGLIGAGQIAQVSHIVNYKSHPNVELSAVCDTNVGTAEKTAATFSIPRFYDSHERMLKEENLDAVSICVPNAFHCSTTLAALRQGCHVYCEKPPAISLKEAKAMAKEAEEKEKLLTFGFHFRHGKNVAFLKQKAGQGAFGRIYQADVQWIRRRGIPGWGNFTSKSLQGGGPLIDLGAHMLDLIFYLMDYPAVSYVCASASDYIGKRGGTGLMGDWSGERFEVEDSLRGFLRMENGASVQLETAFAQNIKERDIRKVMVFGEDMGASLFPLETYHEEDGLQVNQEYPFFPEEDLHKKAILNFVEACLLREPLLVEPWQAVYVQEVLDAMYESAASGQPVRINEEIKNSAT